MRYAIALCVMVALVGVAAAQATRVRTMSLGSTFVVTGQTGALDSQSVRATGLVVVRGKWAKGIWHVLTTTRTDRHGNYKVRVKPGHRGLLVIRITPPDKGVYSFLMRVI